MANTITKFGTLSFVGIEKISSKFGGDQLPVVVTNSGFPQESPICIFSRRSPKNPDSLHLNVVGIPPSSMITITKKIDFCNYDENVEVDKDKWEVDYEGDIGPFFSSVTDDK